MSRFNVVLRAVCMWKVASCMRFDLESGRSKCITEDIKMNATTVGKDSLVNPNEGYPMPDNYKLTVKNLELPFPLEAEVVQSTGDPSNQPTNDSADVPTQPSSTLGEETMDICRSTLAAMRTIQGLKRASSTYSPLSISSFYMRHDDESNGAVTSEDSASSSPCTVQNGKDADGPL